MTTGDTLSVQAEESILEVATQETTTILNFETLVVTSEMKELMVQLAPILLGETNAPLPPYESTTTAIMETGSESALQLPTPVTDIMKELTLQIVGQFFVMMKYCIELVLSGRNLFEFVRSLLENQIENIKQTGDSDCAIAYQAPVEQLGNI